MSAENTIKKQKLEDIEEECSEDIIEAEAETFISLFGKTFIEKELENTDCEDGANADISAKVVSKIREKIKLMKVIFCIQININIFYKLILPFLVGVVMHVQITIQIAEFFKMHVPLLKVKMLHNIYFMTYF